MFTQITIVKIPEGWKMSFFDNKGCVHTEKVCDVTDVLAAVRVAILELRIPPESAYAQA